MDITFTVPDMYVDRVSAAFKVETIGEFKGKIIDVVKDTVRLYEEEGAIKGAVEGVVVEDDIIT